MDFTIYSNLENLEEGTMDQDDQAVDSDPDPSVDNVPNWYLRPNHIHLIPRVYPNYSYDSYEADTMYYPPSYV